MKNVLIVLDYYLPNASANGICVSKIVSELLKYDIDVSIICYADNSREKMHLKNNEVKIPTIYEIDMPKEKQHFRKSRYYMKWILPTKYLPAENKNVCIKMCNLVERVIEEKKIDTLICTYLPIESITVGKIIKNKYPMIKVIAYMLDSLSGGFLPRLLPRTFCKKRKLIWEKRLLVHYDQIILMESSKKHHEIYSKHEKWYQKSYYLDVPALCCPEKSINIPKYNDEIVMSFIGTMSNGVRTPYTFLKVLANVKELRIKIIFAGKNSCENINEYLINSHNITIDVLGEIPYEQAKKILATSDILVNFGNENSNLVPSKIFEYMSYGKPIVSTYTSDSDSSLPYLRKYPTIFFIDEGEKDFIKAAEKLKEFIMESKNIKVPYDYIEHKLYNNTPTAFYDLLSSGGKKI